MGKKRYGLRWTPPGRPEQVNWYDTRDERDIHYARVRQIGCEADRVSERPRRDILPNEGEETAIP